jgi:hypothetical protein
VGHDRADHPVSIAMGGSIAKAANARCAAPDQQGSSAMTTFVDPTTHKPIRQIQIAPGETKVVGLKKYAGGPPNHVVVLTDKNDIAFCYQSVRLKDRSKHSYNKDFASISSFTNELIPIEEKGLFFYQICGKTAGHHGVDCTIFYNLEQDWFICGLHSDRRDRRQQENHRLYDEAWILASIFHDTLEQPSVKPRSQGPERSEQAAQEPAL